MVLGDVIADRLGEIVVIRRLERLATFAVDYAHRRRLLRVHPGCGPGRTPDWLGRCRCAPRGERVTIAAPWALPRSPPSPRPAWRPAPSTPSSAAARSSPSRFGSRPDTG